MSEFNLSLFHSVLNYLAVDNVNLWIKVSILEMSFRLWIVIVDLCPQGTSNTGLLENGIKINKLK